MAHLCLAAGSSLSRSDDLPTKTGFANNDAFVMKDHDSWQRCIEGPGKENQPAGFVDYLGASPVLKSSNDTSCAGSDPANSSRSVSTQLTLFYAGTVNVFENVTANEAHLIMSLAGGNDSSQQAMDMIALLKGQDTTFLQSSLRSKVHEVPKAAINSSICKGLQVPEEGQAQELADFLLPCQASVPKALPLARKESLARFLKSRKERVAMKAPYPVSQDVGCSKASSQMLYNVRWASPSKYKFGFSGENAEAPDWAANYENLKQVSEGESAT